jgi:membrane-bound lytic murein transglycosylase D
MPLLTRTKTLVPAPAALLLAVGLLHGCSSQTPRPDTADQYDPNGVSARAYGYVRPALDVQIRVRGSEARGGRSTPVAELGPIGTGGGSGDLWDRVRGHMALDNPSNPRVDGRVRALQAQADYLTRLSRRAQPYLHMIVRELEQRGMPMELALLPEIESGYNPRALSPKAASGMWQFIPSTGVQMGLAQNDWYDGRNDIVASTRAALSYLESLRKDLGGDWTLAIAAYNCGPERVRSAQQANRAKGKPTDFWSLDLPAETQAYVPQLLAVSRVVAAPGRHGLAMPKVADRPALELVHAPSQIDLTHVAHLAGMNPSDLGGLNPGLKQGKTQPSGPHTLLVPAGAGQPLRLRLAGATSAPLARSAVAVADGDSYRVRKGEDLAAVARQFGVTTADLRAANGLKSSKVAAGARLTIPRDVVASVQVRDGGAEINLVYVVKGGDTLASVARAHKVSRDDLANWNGMARNEPLLPGQRLRVGAGDGQGPAGQSS